MLEKKVGTENSLNNEAIYIMSLSTTAKGTSVRFHYIQFKSNPDIPFHIQHLCSVCGVSAVVGIRERRRDRVGQLDQSVAAPVVGYRGTCSRPIG